MLIGISGGVGCGKNTIVKFLESELGFHRVTVDNTKLALLLDYVTAHWKDRLVMVLDSLETLRAFQVRPFFFHLHIVAPILTRYSRASTELDLRKFAQVCDDEIQTMLQFQQCSKLTIVNDFLVESSLHDLLRKLDLASYSRLRPSWDEYFMRLADLAAQRSNCMKRKVGCVIVCDKRVVATGYNGTPRGLTNCNDGGCPRCNMTQTTTGDSGPSLSTCLCLHAEENALLEAGRARICPGSILYCNTCPCLTCSVKIVQTGISQVFYSQSYKMDRSSAQVLKSAGILLTQWSGSTS